MDGLGLMDSNKISILLVLGPALPYFLTCSKGSFEYGNDSIIVNTCFKENQTTLEKVNFAIDIAPTTICSGHLAKELPAIIT